MIANLIAFFISYRLQREPIYEALSLQDGIHLPGAISRDGMSRHRVSSAIRAAPVVLTPDMRIAEAWGRVKDRELDSWPVADRLGLRGVVRSVDLAGAEARGEGDRLVATVTEEFPAGEEMEEGPEFPHLHPDHNLSLALERMGVAHRNALPVVSRGNVRQLLGVVTLEDVLKVYGVDEATKDGSGG